MLVEMRSQHEMGNKTAGFNVFTGKFVDMWKESVLEPLRIKTQAISSAMEASTMILRIDDVLSQNTSILSKSTMKFANDIRDDKKRRLQEIQS